MNLRDKLLNEVEWSESDNGPVVYVNKVITFIESLLANQRKEYEKVANKEYEYYMKRNLIERARGANSVLEAIEYIGVEHDQK